MKVTGKQMLGAYKELNSPSFKSDFKKYKTTKKIKSLSIEPKMPKIKMPASKTAPMNKKAGYRGTSTGFMITR